MSKYINHLAARIPEGCEALSIHFAWPFAAWRCVTPSSLSRKINILEKLILSLIDKRLVKSKTELTDLLCHEIGLDTELIENAIDLCEQKGYINRQTAEIRLNKGGKEALDICNDEPLTESAEGELSNIYLFRELVTGAIVPVFDIVSEPFRGGEKLESLEAFDGFLPEYSEESSEYGAPKAAEMQNALKTWKRLSSMQIMAEVTESRTIDSGTNSVPPEYMPDKGKVADNSAFIQLVADSPEVCYLDGYFILNRYHPTDADVISPFGELCDSWFSIIVERARANSKVFEDLFQTKLSLKREELKDTVAFRNDLQIALFDRIPAICNDEAYRELKNRIEAMNEFLAKPDDKKDSEYHNFASSMRQAIEFTLRKAVELHPEFENTRNDMRDLFEKDGQTGVLNYSIKADPNLSKGLATPGVIKNMINERSFGSGQGAKDMLLLITIHSVYGEHNKEPARTFVTRSRLWSKKLFYLINNVCNAASHGNVMKKKKSPEDYYKDTEQIITDIFEHLILGGEHQ